MAAILSLESCCFGSSFKAIFFKLLSLAGPILADAPLRKFGDSPSTTRKRILFYSFKMCVFPLTRQTDFLKSINWARNRIPVSLSQSRSSEAERTPRPHQAGTRSQGPGHGRRGGVRAPQQPSPETGLALSRRASLHPRSVDWFLKRAASKSSRVLWAPRRGKPAAPGPGGQHPSSAARARVVAVRKLPARGAGPWGPHRCLSDTVFQTSLESSCRAG